MFGLSLFISCRMVEVPMSPSMTHNASGLGDVLKKGD